MAQANIGRYMDGGRGRGECASEEESSDCGEKYDIKAKMGGGGGFLGSESECEDDLFQDQDACAPEPVCQPEPVCPPEPCASELAPVGSAIGAASAKKSTKKPWIEAAVTFHAIFQFSCKDAAEDAEAAVWSIQPGAMYALKKEKVEGDLRPKGEQLSRVGNPQKSVIRKITVKSVCCDSPVGLHVRIPLVEGTSFSQDGKPYTFLANADERMRGELVVFESAHTNEGQHMKTYGDVTKESLDQTYTPNVDRDYYNVRADSELVKVMKMNEPWKSEIKAATLISDGIDQYKLPVKTVNKVKKHMVAMLDRLPHVNIEELGLVLSRADGRAWDARVGLAATSGEPEEQAAAVDEQLAQSFRAEFEFTVQYGMH